MLIGHASDTRPGPHLALVGGFAAEDKEKLSGFPVAV
jgi:hypothetical protein